MLVLQATPFAVREREREGPVIELLQWQKLAMTSEICVLCRSHLLSWSSNYITKCLVDVSLSSYVLLSFLEGKVLGNLRSYLLVCTHRWWGGQ